MRTISATKQEPGACPVLRGSSIFLTQIAKSATNPLKNSPYQSEEKASYKIYTCKIKNAVCVKNPPDDTSKVEHIAVLRGARFSVPRRHSCRRFSEFSIPPSAEKLSRLTTVKTTRNLQRRRKNLALPPSSSGPAVFLAHLAETSVKMPKDNPYHIENTTAYRIYTCKIKNAGCAKNDPDDTSKEEQIAALTWRTLQRAASALLPTLGFVFSSSLSIGKAAPRSAADALGGPV